MGVIFCYWISITVSCNSSQIWTRVELFDNLLLETMSKYFQLNYISVHHLQIIFLCILPIQWAKWGSLCKGGVKLLKLKPFHGPCAQFLPFTTLDPFILRPSPPSSPTLPAVPEKPLACSDQALGFWLLTGLSQCEPGRKGQATESGPFVFISPAPFLPDLSEWALSL